MAAGTSDLLRLGIPHKESAQKQNYTCRKMKSTTEGNNRLSSYWTFKIPVNQFELKKRTRVSTLELELQFGG